jgi:hypothetical protein
MQPAISFPTTNLIDFEVLFSKSVASLASVKKSFASQALIDSYQCALTWTNDN